MSESLSPPTAFPFDVGRFPRLSEATSQNADLKAEVRALIDELRPPRSRRKPQRVLAKILRDLNGTRVDETVVVREVSATGIVVELQRHSALELFEACHLTFGLRSQQDSQASDLELSATLVRLLELRDGVVVLAFRFDDPNEAEQEALYELGHACGSRQT